MGDGVTHVAPAQGANKMKESEPDNSSGGRMMGPGRSP